MFLETLKPAPAIPPEDAVVFIWTRLNQALLAAQAMQMIALAEQEIMPAGKKLPVVGVKTLYLIPFTVWAMNHPFGGAKRHALGQTCIKGSAHGVINFLYQ